MEEEIIKGMLGNGIEKIISSDRHFDKLPGIGKIDTREMYRAC